jgi:hypothetical protein
MPDKNKQSYAFAALTPIISGSTQGVIHAAELRSVLARLNEWKESPFTRVPGTHFARWNVIDDMPQLGFPTADDHLQSKYLMLETDFDGDRDTWIDGLATAMPDVIDLLYRHCEGYPGVVDLAGFRAYLLKCQLHTTLDFAPYAESTLDTVLRALDTQRKFVGFMHATQGKSSLELRVAFTDFMKRVEQSPTPPPGSI